MNHGPLFEKLSSRVQLDKSDGDFAYFQALSLQLEYITKLVVSGIIACVGNDPQRHRYTLEHALVRANSIGEWVRSLNAALTGSAAQYIRPSCVEITRDLTERVSESDWRYDAVQKIGKVAELFGLDPQIGRKVGLRQFFDITASIRNRTRGHGATTWSQCGQASLNLAESITSVMNNLILFKRDWAHIYRSLSGKYRVSPLLGDCLSFNYLKSSRDIQLPNGVYFDVSELIINPLVITDPELTDIFLPNGNHNGKTFESLSFITNEIELTDSSSWLTPPGRLPESETEGSRCLDVIGNSFSNIPPSQSGRVPRPVLEKQLKDELLDAHRHPIISLTGPGGIGKTTLAIAVLEDLCDLVNQPFDVVLWLSSRDIDLLESGPKPVSPRVVRKEEIARAGVELLQSDFQASNPESPIECFQNYMKNGADGSTLFVFDNFETLENPIDVFNWIDTYIRLPNKVLITTRFRDFNGDYPIEIVGMSESEAHALIDREASRLGITDLLGHSYIDELISESDGHPYVIKILLGQVAKERKAVKPQRIVANADYILTALFERTFESLSPSAQRIFLLLCSWRVFIPEIAVEAVSLRQDNERFDVANAFDELRRFSLIQDVDAKADKEKFVCVPLAAASFGRRKLDVSPFKIAIEEDRSILMEFGAGKREDAHHGVLPRVDRLIRSVANRVRKQSDSLDTLLPILEYIASRVPHTYLRIANLVLDVNGSCPSAYEMAKGYLRRFLEVSQPHERREAWLGVADLCHKTNDAMGEVHALSEVALSSKTDIEEIGDIANRINNRIKDLKGRKVEDAWSPEVRLLIERVANSMENHISSLTADDCSRLAWLYLNIGNEERARDVSRRGLETDPSNMHCSRLVTRLKM